MEDFGRRLQKALDHADMKPAELSRRTGIGKSSISTYLAGGYHPKQDKIYKMADALNVNPEWLNGRAEDMESTPLQNAKIAVNKYNLYIEALNTLGWDERVVNQYGEEFSTLLDEDKEKHNEWRTILTNGTMSFNVTHDDTAQFEEDLLDFVAQRIQTLMIKASKTINPKA